MKYTSDTSVTDDVFVCCDLYINFSTSFKDIVMKNYVP